MHVDFCIRIAFICEILHSTGVYRSSGRWKPSVTLARVFAAAVRFPATAGIALKPTLLKIPHTSFLSLNTDVSAALAVAHCWKRLPARQAGTRQQTTRAMTDGKRKAEESAEAGPAKRAPGVKPGVHPKRIRELKPGAVQQGPVIYW